MVTTGQLDLFDEIIVDNFAGGGGASTGIELATGKVVSIAVNHDPSAIRLHKTNHPFTAHYQESVWNVDPVKVCGGRPVGLAWFSPDCKHFSKAKGAALVDKKIRGLAWIVLRWAGTVKPRVIILENVEEFVTWGPVRKGKPVRKKAGETFRKWLGQLEALGYHVEHRELVAADYGVPTTRKRFYLIARCDGKPIVWPEPTHAPRDSEAVRLGHKLPWRSAAEIIDWSLPSYSIFDSKAEIKAKYGVNAIRPLAENTMKRIIRGVDKFTLRSGKPFIVPTGYGERAGQQPRVHSINNPLPTVVGSGKHNLCEPLLAPLTVTNTSNSVGHPASEPMDTARTGGGGGQMLVATQLIQYHTEQTEAVRGQDMTSPLRTIDGSNRHGLVSANLVEYYSNGRPLPIDEPMHTATSHDREALIEAFLQPCHAGGYKGKGNSPLAPVNTITGVGGQSLVMPCISEFKGKDIGQNIDRPLRTITAGGGEFGVVRTTVTQYAPGVDLGYWPKVRALLNQHCGYDLKDNEVILIFISGVAYFIADISLRMLTPRELYNAMGFLTDYIITRDYLGNEYKKTDQVARCGNAVCPPMATALVKANLPEWCQRTYTTMADFTSAVAVGGE